MPKAASWEPVFQTQVSVQQVNKACPLCQALDCSGGDKTPPSGGAQVRQVTAPHEEGWSARESGEVDAAQGLLGAVSALSWDLPVPPRKTSVDMAAGKYQATLAPLPVGAPLLLSSLSFAKHNVGLFLAEKTLMVAADTGRRGSEVPTQGPEQKGQRGA